MGKVNRHMVVVVTSVIILVACKPSVPSQYIQPDDMEDILYDYYVSQGMADLPNDNSRDREYQRDLYFNIVLKKYGLTRAEFDSSMVYYYTRADRFLKIYKNVQERLSEDALALGASEGEVERYMMTQSLTGDTANIWEGRRFMQLIPNQPYNKVQFSQKADTAFRKGDSFLLSFQSDFLYQGGAKDAIAYLAVKYDNDSVCSTVSHFSIDGNNQLRVNSCDNKVKEISGFFYLGEGFDKSPNLRLLFLSHVQLIRFHQKKSETKQDPVPSATKSDSVKMVPDSLRPKYHKLGERPTLMKDENVKPITN